MIVHTFYHHDYRVKILGMIPAELVHVPLYWSLFGIGIIAGRGQWLEKLPSSYGPRWLPIGLSAFFVALLTQPFLPLFLEDMILGSLTFLGTHWGILWGLLEAFICVGLVVRLSVLFRERFSTPGTWMARLDQNVFGVYIFHVFILVALQGTILDIALPALVKFAIVTIAGLIISFLNSALLRRIPGVNRVI